VEKLYHAASLYFCSTWAMPITPSMVFVPL